MDEPKTTETVGGADGLSITEAAQHYGCTAKTLRNRINDGVLEYGGVPFEYRKIEGARGPEYRIWIGGPAPYAETTILPPDGATSGEAGPGLSVMTIQKAMSASVASRLAPVEADVRAIKDAMVKMAELVGTLNALGAMLVDERAHTQHVYRALSVERQRTIDAERRVGEAMCPWWRSVMEAAEGGAAELVIAEMGDRAVNGVIAPEAAGC